MISKLVKSTGITIKSGRTATKCTSMPFWWIQMTLIGSFVVYEVQSRMMSEFILKGGTTTIL
jgi:hypothetical protein